jgi:hypothetical protein
MTSSQFGWSWLLLGTVFFFIYLALSCNSHRRNMLIGWWAHGCCILTEFQYFHWCATNNMRWSNNVDHQQRLVLGISGFLCTSMSNDAYHIKETAEFLFRYDLLSWSSSYFAVSSSVGQIKMVLFAALSRCWALQSTTSPPGKWER